MRAIVRKPIKCINTHCCIEHICACAWYMCDVTAIAIAAAAVYSFNHVTCAHDSHALIQNRVLLMVSAAVLHVCLRKGGVTTVVGLTIG